MYANNPSHDPNAEPRVQTSIVQKVAADLAGLVEALQSLESDLAGYSRNLSIGSMGSADQDLLAAGIRRAAGNQLLDASTPLENGHLYAELPSSGYNDLRLNVTYLGSKPSDLFVRQMGHPRNGAAEFYSMRVQIDAADGSLYFADPVGQGMLESNDWARANEIVDDMRSAVASLADKLNRSDISEKLR